MRDFLLRLAAAAGLATALLTELLSPFHLLRPAPLAAGWLLVVASAAGYLYVRRRSLHRVRPRPMETAAALIIAAIASIVGVAAALSPPNSADAMSYHMPRVVYWAQQGSVAFFPTPYFNQITLQPLAEYFMLHAYVLSGGDAFTNLVGFCAFLGSIVGVLALAGALGLNSKGQALAALVCATLPNGILQASGAKNDWMLTLWLVSMTYFAIRRNAPFTGLCLGLALATKATGYLFAPPMLALALWWAKPPGFVRRWPAWLLAGVLALNGPQYIRNVRLSGSPLGYDSAHGDGFFRWRNESFGWKATASNVLRNASEQLGARDQGWNQRIYEAVVGLHNALGIDPQDPGTTWRWSRYEPPVNAKNHEANAHSRWHLLLMAAAAAFALARREWRWALYGTALILAFLAFCSYLKWQPYLARLELPLFILGSPLAAFLLARPESRAGKAFMALVCVLLVNNARPALFENWTRPLQGPRNIFETPREERYFADMAQWNNRPWYLEAVDRTARSGCADVGIDIGIYQLEYPFQALLLQRNPGVRFVHTGVVNASARYYPPGRPPPCAVLCLECAANREKIALYGPIGPPVEIGRFLLFLRPR